MQAYPVMRFDLEEERRQHAHSLLTRNIALCSEVSTRALLAIECRILNDFGFAHEKVVEFLELGGLSEDLLRDVELPSEPVRIPGRAY